MLGNSSSHSRLRVSRWLAAALAAVGRWHARPCGLFSLAGQPWLCWHRQSTLCGALCRPFLLLLLWYSRTCQISNAKLAKVIAGRQCEGIGAATALDQSGRINTHLSKTQLRFPMISTLTKCGIIVGAYAQRRACRCPRRIAPRPCAASGSLPLSNAPFT